MTLSMHLHLGQLLYFTQQLQNASTVLLMCALQDITTSVQSWYVLLYAKEYCTVHLPFITKSWELKPLLCSVWSTNCLTKNIVRKHVGKMWLWCNNNLYMSQKDMFSMWWKKDFKTVQTKKRVEKILQDKIGHPKNWPREAILWQLDSSFQNNIKFSAYSLICSLVSAVCPI